MFKTMMFTTAALAAVATTPAAAQTITNGSFENFSSQTRPSGTGTYNAPTGWTFSTPLNNAESRNFPPSVITYGTAAEYPTGAYNEAVPAPAAGGTHGLLFSSDTANPQTLSQNINIATAGAYTFSFNYYIPSNGAQNFYNGSLSFSVGGQQAGQTLNLQGLGASNGTWRTFQTTANLAAGQQTLGFNFNADGLTAIDVVVDQVAVSAVPEPASWAMMIVGLGMVGGTARRRRTAGKLALA